MKNIFESISDALSNRPRDFDDELDKEEAENMRRASIEYRNMLEVEKK